MEQVAIIGAGPGGIAVARELKRQGFAPTIFEMHDSAGGQWNNASKNSGVWPKMRTNTYLEATRFSEDDYPEGTALFPRNTEVLAHFQAYADRHGVLDNARFNTELVRLERTDGGYRLTLRSGEKNEVLTFPKVVVATGRYNKPTIPPIPGIESFTGELGVNHCFHYKDPELYRGRCGFR